MNWRQLHYYQLSNNMLYSIWILLLKLNKYTVIKVFILLFMIYNLSVTECRKLRITKEAAFAQRTKNGLFPWLSRKLCGFSVSFRHSFSCHIFNTHNLSFKTLYGSLSLSTLCVSWFITPCINSSFPLQPKFLQTDMYFIKCVNELA